MLIIPKLLGTKKPDNSQAGCLSLPFITQLGFPLRLGGGSLNSHGCVNDLANHWGQPVTVGFVAAIDRIFIRLLNTRGDGAAPAIAKYALID